MVLKTVSIIFIVATLTLSACGPVSLGVGATKTVGKAAVKTTAHVGTTLF